MLGQLVRFYIVGASGVVANLGLLWLLTEAGLWYMVSAIIAIAVSISTNFFGNKFWTFGRRDGGVKVIRQYGYFWAASLIGMAIQLGLLWLLVELVGLWYILAAMAAIATASISNFILTKWWVFR